MSKRKQEEAVYDDGSYVVKKSRKTNIIAFVLCVLVALMIWLYATNMESKEQEEQSSTSAHAMADERLDTVV